MLDFTLLIFTLSTFKNRLIEMKAATPAGTARAVATGLSGAKEAAEAVPAESVRHNEN